MLELAETRWSGPISTCNSAMAASSPMRACCRASACSTVYWAMRVCDEAKASRPTAMSVSSIMRVSVATSAKPRFFRLSRRLGTGVWWMSFILERVECY